MVRKEYWEQSKELIEWCNESELKVLTQQAEKALNKRMEQYTKTIKKVQMKLKSTEMYDVKLKGTEAAVKKPHLYKHEVQEIQTKKRKRNVPDGSASKKRKVCNNFLKKGAAVKVMHKRKLVDATISKVHLPLVLSTDEINTLVWKLAGHKYITIENTQNNKTRKRAKILALKKEFHKEFREDKHGNFETYGYMKKSTIEV